MCNSPPGPCSACNARPKYFDGTKTHPYCSKTCAAKMKNTCEACHTKPKHFDGVKTHPYCGRSCADKMKMCDVCHTRPKYVAGTQTHSCCGKTCAAKMKMCDYCHKHPKYDDGKMTHSCCSKTCAQQAKAAAGVGGAGGSPSCVLKNACLLCGKAATNGCFCSHACASKADKDAPLLLEVHSGHDMFKNVARQFEASWRHPKPRPTVRRVYKVIGDPALTSKYEAYRASVEARGNFAATGCSPGNEMRRWHGTTRKCLLGDNGNAALCSSSSCSLCCIIRRSFKLDHSGTKFRFARFGKGIYMSSTSSKCDDYSENTTTSTQKAMLLNNVVVGNGCEMTQNKPELTKPPPGYDSVLGEVVNGGSLNYDELVCYTEDAVRPSFLVIYDACK